MLTYTNINFFHNAWMCIGVQNFENSPGSMRIKLRVDCYGLFASSMYSNQHSLKKLEKFQFLHVQVNDKSFNLWRTLMHCNKKKLVYHSMQTSIYLYKKNNLWYSLLPFLWFQNWIRINKGGWKANVIRVRYH